jgi:hypothetical protein
MVKTETGIQKLYRKDWTNREIPNRSALSNFLIDPILRFIVFTLIKKIITEI